MRFDYTTVGHVTADVMVDGSRRVGGSAFYGALQAARLGLRTLILTRGVPGEIEALLAPYRGELELEVLAAAETTTLETSGSGTARNQRLLAWAGPIADGIEIDTTILHLAPVARETPRRWRGRANFVGWTAQGLVRAWGETGGQLHPTTLERSLVPERCDAIVISETERDSCASLMAGAHEDAHDGRVLTAAGETLVAVTARAAPTALQLPGGEVIQVAVPAIERLRDDIGEGDVFAAAFFVALKEGRSPQEAASFANAAAAVRITGAGAGAIGDRSAIEARLGAAAENDPSPPAAGPLHQSGHSTGGHLRSGRPPVRRPRSRLHRSAARARQDRARTRGRRLARPAAGCRRPGPSRRPTRAPLAPPRGRSRRAARRTPRRP